MLRKILSSGMFSVHVCGKEQLALVLICHAFRWWRKIYVTRAHFTSSRVVRVGWLQQKLSDSATKFIYLTEISANSAINVDSGWFLIQTQHVKIFLKKTWHAILVWEIKKRTTLTSGNTFRLISTEKKWESSTNNETGLEGSAANT